MRATPPVPAIAGQASRVSPFREHDVRPPPPGSDRPLAGAAIRGRRPPSVRPRKTELSTPPRGLPVATVKLPDPVGPVARAARPRIPVRRGLRHGRRLHRGRSRQGARDRLPAARGASEARHPTPRALPPHLPAQRAPALRPRERLLPPLAGRRDALHLRLLPGGDRDPGRGARGQDAAGLPEAPAEARREGRGGGLRLGRDGPPHGPEPRGDGARLQPLARAGAVRARPGAPEGLEGRVEFVEEDYRNIEGRFDAFVSLGMLEHVGPKGYPALGSLLDRCLDQDHGRGLLHFIGQDRPTPLNPWIRRWIFPGAYPPTVGEALRGVLEPDGWAVLDVENLRPHYALTLRHWRERFEAHEAEVAAPGRALRAAVAPLSRRLRGGLPGRLPGAVPGRLRTPWPRRRALGAGRVLSGAASWRRATS